MPLEDTSFEALEKQLARDALEKALKDLHGEINKEIDKNKRNFSDEIKRSLSNLTRTLETHISSEVDKKVSFHLEKNFSGVSKQVKDSFDQMFSPIMEKTEEDMQLLQDQGKNTLQSWKTMMLQYESLWTKPFFLMMLVSILTGAFSSFLFTYFMIREERRARQFCESSLYWFVERERERTAALKAEKPDTLPQTKTKAKPRLQNKTQKRPK